MHMECFLDISCHPIQRLEMFRIFVRSQQLAPGSHLPLIGAFELGKKLPGNILLCPNIKI